MFRAATPYLVLVAALIAVSFAAIFVRLADAPGVVVAAYRMVIASLVILPLTLKGLRTTPISRETLGYTVLAGLFLAAHFATFISSLSYTSVAAAVTLVTTTPLWVALFSWWFLGLAPTLLTMLGLLCAVAGGALIGFSGAAAGGTGSFGNLLALLGAITFSAYVLLGRSAQRRGLSLQAYAGAAYSIAALALVPLPFLFGLSYGGYSLETLFWILMLALVPQLVGHTGINYAVNMLEPTFVATVLLLEPIGSGLLALLIFAERPTPSVIVGAVILLIGVALTARRDETSKT